MNLDLDDIRAAVTAGTITEGQAAGIMALADARAKGRPVTGDMDEPFELFHGFNEVFIVLGLGVLFAGWIGVLSIALTWSMKATAIVVLGFVGMGALALLARYFTLKRKMNGPSSALAAMFAFCSGLVGFGIGLGTSGEVFLTSGFAAASGSVGMLLYFIAFRVPFALAVVALGALGASFCFIAWSGDILTSPREFFLLSSSGLYGWATIVVGFLALGVAMMFDLSDPHRVTRRATNAFWLHIVAAPTIVNTIAATLAFNATWQSYGWLVLFFAVLTLFAIVIDRRSFLIAASGYIAALFYSITPEVFHVGSFALGSFLILLGAQWEVLRGALMRSLPAFPGKDRLPPWRVGSVEG
ncbi:hypothetical protein PGB28_04220 [Primorskyibacter aestuariivivens]|uniref:hypothetical protein n=1 Tax=Primorskyibacter aestuariivivens TaxID=1888912 RepID=UPI0023006C21|nr:hypothetical protein [Primorskyibacter aestuariivivens]MDA7427652.1 hypothetical protein [Primorskyibacter aestuariivivens]